MKMFVAVVGGLLVACLMVVSIVGRVQYWRRLRQLQRSQDDLSPEWLNEHVYRDGRDGDRLDQ